MARPGTDNRHSNGPASPLTSRSRPPAQHAASKDAAPQILTVRVPLRLHRRGGRKVVLTPAGGAAYVPRQTGVDNAMVKAVARAFRWRKMLENGTYATITEIAAAEKINESYVEAPLHEGVGCRAVRMLKLFQPACEGLDESNAGPKE
jgi:hypothetical protein